MKPYFYVYRYQDKAPIIRHPTIESAQAEAERLATQHKGTAFEILKAVGLSQVSGPASTFFMDGEGPTEPKHLFDAESSSLSLTGREPTGPCSVYSIPRQRTYNCPPGGNGLAGTPDPIMNKALCDDAVTGAGAG